MASRPLTVALVGNPNTGKSTLFNALSGLRQHVGNYPGVTVEMKKGSFTHGDRRVDLIDLPGTYSLAARSPDELVAVDLLLGRRPEEPPPDVILSIVDASNLDRHLYLTTQVMELGVPVVLAVNMIDLATNQGVRVDVARLAAETGLPVVPVQANRGSGLAELKDALVKAADSHQRPNAPALPAPLEAEAQAVATGLKDSVPPFLARRLLLDVSGATETWFVQQHGEALRTRVIEARKRLANAGAAVPAVEAKARYAYIRKVTAAAVSKPTVRPKNTSDKLDRVLTHKVWGTLVFFAVMFLMFWSIFTAATPLMDLIDAGTGWFGKQVEEQMSAGPLRSLVVDGIITGVGGVVKFLPQILILFAFIAVLEDCGYMARAAFLMDRLMSRCGLSGKSFIPMLSSVACAVPGVMATRVIENHRDRLATILVAPLMSCSARIPVYVLMISLFLPDESAFAQALVMFAMYMIGFVAAPLVAWVLRKTLLRGERSLFVMELPAYKQPSVRTVGLRVFDAGWQFLKRAGTVILASMIVIWAVQYFPNWNAEGQTYEGLVTTAEDARDEAKKQAAEAEGDDKERAEVEANAKTAEVKHLKAEWQRNSLLGQTGRALEPLFAPLGWDWKIGMATLASFPAREVIVGTLRILYEADEAEDGQADPLRGSIRDDWDTDPVRGKNRVPVALSVMVFFALCMQCASTLVVIRRETKSWRWPVFCFTYMTILAYLGALVTFQIGRLIVGMVS
ncbi:MAG: ferrous iron transport protein B [Fimbriiglobus sp.]|jgi:ferrous iron transport protein B|nr:ferrous iron transport protein B [Fimbriiglobus sp.]